MATRCAALVKGSPEFPNTNHENAKDEKAKKMERAGTEMRVVLRILFFAFSSVVLS
jgi:hypothetical protein